MAQYNFLRSSNAQRCKRWQKFDCLKFPFPVFFPEVQFQMDAFSVKFYAIWTTNQDRFCLCHESDKLKGICQSSCTEYIYLPVESSNVNLVRSGTCTAVLTVLGQVESFVPRVHLCSTLIAQHALRTYPICSSAPVVPGTWEWGRTWLGARNLRTPWQVSSFYRCRSVLYSYNRILCPITMNCLGYFGPQGPSDF